MASWNGFLKTFQKFRRRTELTLPIRYRFEPINENIGKIHIRRTDTGENLFIFFEKTSVENHCRIDWETLAKTVGRARQERKYFSGEIKPSLDLINKKMKEYIGGKNE